MYPAGQSKSWDMDEKVQPCWGSDVDYLYSDEDVLILIDALLKKGGKEREKHGLERDIIKEGESFGDTIILAPLSEGDDQEQLVYLTNSIDKAILYRLKQLLVPINVQNVHWVTLQLKIRSVQFGQPEITAVIHDSNGSHTSKIVANLVNSKSISIEAESSLTKIQKEKMNNYCGGYTARLIASLTSDISGVKWGNGEESADDRILRETDLKLVKEYCPHLAHKFCPGQLSTDFQSFNLANRDINRDTGATMSLRYETVLSRVVNHLGKIDDNRIKSLDNDIKLTIEDIISVLQELIHAENNDLVHILSGNTKYGSIFSQNPMKANQSTIELLTQIKFAIARDSGKLIKPMLIISEVIQKETIFPTILIMPRVYKTWNGKVITNKSETLYFVDATSTFERLDSISQLLKQYLCYGSYSNNLTGLFPDGLIECNTVANQVTDAEAIANSGWWNIYNNIMLVHDGSDLFLNRFSERNIERTGKLKYILSLLAIKSLKEKRGCVVSSDSIFDDKRFEEFVKIDNEIKGDYRKIVEDIKASRATTETVDKNSKLMRTDLISEEKTLIYQYNILQEEVNQMEKSTENDPLNYDDDTLAKEIERFVSGKTKEVFEKSSDCKREQLERLVLSNNGAAIRAFVEQTKSEYLERKSSYQMTLDTKEKEQSKLQQSITFLKAEKTSKQEELSRINEILRKLTTEKTIMNQMKNLIQEFIRELRMMNLFNYKEIGAKFNLNALEDKEGTSKVINEVMSSLDSRVKAINKTKNELEEESDQISKQITMLEKKVAEWHIELTRVDKKLNDIITLSRKYNNLKSLISVLEQSKGQNLLEVSNRIRQMQSISSYVGKVQELWNNNSQLKEEAISRVRMGLLGGPLVAIGSAIWERNTFLSKINDKVQSILSGEIADIVYSMKILGCSPTSVAEEINKLQREITKLRNDIYAANEQINGLKKQLELIHKQIAELYCIDDLLSSTSSQITAILKIVIAKLDEIVSSIAANEAAKNQLGIAIKAIENQLITLETKSTVNLLEINKLKPIILNLNRKIQELLEKYREYLTPQDSVTANEYFIGSNLLFIFVLCLCQYFACLYLCLLLIQVDLLIFHPLQLKMIRTVWSNIRQALIVRLSAMV